MLTSNMLCILTTAELEQFCCGVYSRADLVLLVVLIGYTRVALAISLHQLNKFLIKLNTIVIFIG